ncbi:MAG TPA: tartrate dehydrogenase [Vicinamibacteria bacterium]|nr:tartrate dehydrogenase [Vicinamibacteria bacterium]
MKAYRIASIPGDGIGHEVVAEGVRVVAAAARRFGFTCAFEELPWGSQHYLERGRMMPDDALTRLSGFDAIYLGAVGHPKVPDHTTLNGLLLPIRRAFEQYANVRPTVLFPGVATPLAEKEKPIDIVLVRENTEGEYAQVGGTVHGGTGNEVAVQTAVFTRLGTERIIRFAFELAQAEGRRSVTSITKSNAQGHSMTFWDRVFREVAAQFPKVETASILVDAAAMELIRRPWSFDVIVASNLFGDICSEITATVTGGLGLAPSANLDPTRRHPSMFEPVHGSAPDIAGRGIANPVGAILSAGLMLAWLGESAAAEAIQAAVRQALGPGGVRTRDIGGQASTVEMGEAVARALDAR